MLPLACQTLWPLVRSKPLSSATSGAQGLLITWAKARSLEEREGRRERERKREREGGGGKGGERWLLDTGFKIKFNPSDKNTQFQNIWLLNWSPKKCYVILLFHQKCIKWFVSPYSSQQQKLTIFSIITILWVKNDIILAYGCIYLIRSSIVNQLYK